MNVLSLFDGMACGMIAMQLAGVSIESYDAYEIDKYAIQTAQHNFPMIRENGDVFKADFTEYRGVDFLVGGSPCTYWSIAQTKNRETTASGMGWDLFSQYVRALRESQPKYFIYENNYSMSKEIRRCITETFGFEPIMINSDLVSAQNRKRLYWVGKRNADGTYSKVNVEQPEDRGILLKDVLDSAVAMSEKAHAVIASAGRTTEREYFIKNQGNMATEPVCLLYERTEDAKRCRKEYERHEIHHGYNELNELHPRPDGKTNTLTTVQKDNQIAVPITDICQVGAMPMPNGELSTSAGFRVYSTEAKGRYLCANGGGAGAKTGLYAVPVMPVFEATASGYTEIECGDCVDLSMPNSKTRRGRNMADKSNCMQTSNEFYQYVGYAIEFDENGNPIKAIGKDGKQITVYEVINWQITIKDKRYPIKLRDGFYIIRKLTVSECKRLQTVPEWYEFPVSNSQAHKMLGNGWTCEVIAHLIRACFVGNEYATVETVQGWQYTLF